jgi:hypothetical protein
MVTIVGHSLLLLFLSQCTLHLLPWDSAIGGMALLQYAVITTCCACLLAPSINNRLLSCLIWGLAGGVCFLTGALLSGTTAWQPLLGGMLGVAALVTMLALLSKLIECRTESEAFGKITGLMLFATAATLPLWLSPIAEIFNSHQGLIDGILVLSPLSHLAVLLQVDFLHSDWFYQNSAFGSLRFHYPAIWQFATLYLVLIAAIIYLTSVKPGDNRS